MLRVSEILVGISASTLPSPMKQRPLWITLQWIGDEGFGEVILQITEGKIEIFSEKMGKEFVKELLCNMIEDGTLLE